MSKLSSQLLHQSSVKLNAAGLTPECSLVLPERAAKEDEVAIMHAIEEMYSSQTSFLSTHVFSPQVVFTMPSGDVSVGVQGLETKAQAAKSAPGMPWSVRLRLLETPSVLAPQSLCVDLVRTSTTNESTQSLLVLKRRPVDGLVTSIIEEEGHRRATAPLAARTASAGNFCSPTDNMLSPCTSKLNLVKKKHHLKGKPTTLFAAQMAPKAPSHLSDEMEI